MSGRPKKKPEYDAEKQFDAFLQELSVAYEEADSMRGLAQELNITLLKLRKLLITAGIFTSDICTEINELYKHRKSVPEIMQITGLSRASVHSYLPYTKGLYNAAEISQNAERCRTYKNRQEQVRFLQEIPSEEKYSGVRPHKEIINISKEIINKTGGAEAPYAAQIFIHLSVVSSRQR